MKSVMKGSHKFSEAPSMNMPRSMFDRSHGLKTTFDAGELVPIYVDEALPGDTFNMRPSMFARLATPIHPLMDNMYMDVHFFSVPVRQIWDNFRKFCGEQTDPGDSTDYLIPQATVTTAKADTFEDYIGLPVGGANDVAYSDLFYRAYAHIYNEWYRDQNLQDSASFNTDDTGPVIADGRDLFKRGKRHDYFTSCLPWLQKGDAVTLPLGTSAPLAYDVTQGDGTLVANEISTSSELSMSSSGFLLGTGFPHVGGTKAFADLTDATASTVNELRQAFQIQKLLERDARSGTRYSEIVKAHFGVQFTDMTYRPEFLGGSSAQINFHSVPQTSETNITPQGNLSSFATTSLQGGGFSKSFNEHCIVFGIASVRADLTYQQGINRMFSRRTRYDLYWPALAHLGEQAVLNQEIYHGFPTDNIEVFGYQERWAEYRYKPSQITGKFRSNASGTLDAWHLSQEFSSLPGLNATFIEENPPLDRVVAIPSEPKFICDCYFELKCARPLPTYSVPGLIDHF